MTNVSIDLGTYPLIRIAYINIDVTLTAADLQISCVL